MPNFSFIRSNVCGDIKIDSLCIYVDDNDIIDDEFINKYILEKNYNRNIEGLFFSPNRTDKFLIPDNSPIEFKLSEGFLSKYKWLKQIAFCWSSVGITDEMFKDCENLEYIFLGTPLDKPLKTFDTIINLPNLKEIYLNGFGLAKMSDEFVEWYLEKTNEKAHIIKHLC